MSLGGQRTGVVLKFYDSWNRGEIDFDELVDEDIVNHQPDVEPELGRDPFREAIAGVMAAEPDSRWKSPMYWLTAIGLRSGSRGAAPRSARIPG